MRRVICLAICIIITLFSLYVVAAGEVPQKEDLFFSSNKAYKEDRFQEAIEGYEQLIRQGYRNGHLYYNLGNAYFRLNYLGQAILHYERAHLLIPRNADLNFNLDYARDQTKDAINTSTNFMSMTLFWLDSLSLNELFWGFAITNGLFWFALIIRFIHQSEWIYYLTLFILIVWLVSGISYGSKWYQLKNDTRAVIIAQEVNVLAGPDARDTILFKLHEGTIVYHERQEDGWTLVHLPDKKRGWVSAEAIETIIETTGK